MSELMDDEQEQENTPEENCERDEDKPIFPGSPVTMWMAIVMILSFITRHKLTKATVTDLIQLINLLFGGPVTGFQLTSSYIEKFIEKAKYGIEKHTYCTQCQVYIADVNSVDVCPVEGCHRNLREDGAVSYFIVVPLLDQLCSLMSRVSICEIIFGPKKQPNADYLGDITDGNVYKYMYSKCKHLHFISMSWNTDGVSVFKSSKFSIWPLYMTINELPQHMRFKDENLILAGLWFGPKKPLMQTFLKPIYPMLHGLENGFMIDTAIGKKKLHGFVIAGTADLPARALALNMIMFNGYN
jgi:hypothetical protein